MRLFRNVGAGIFASVWTAILGLAVVPLYLRFLGLEAYGLIGFFSTVQALFQLLDLGIQPTINREIARGQTAGHMDGARVLLRSLEALYWIVAACIALLMSMLASVIGRHWLHAESLSGEMIAESIFLMGLVIAARWPTGLYQSALNGLQKIVLTSTVTIVTGTLGSLGAVFVLAFVSRTLAAFFIWQASVGVAAALVARVLIWRELRGDAKVKVSLTALKSIWKFSASMTALTISGLVFSQLDRVLLSKILNLQAFGEYVLAGVVASSLGMLTAPFYNALYPRFSAYVASGAEAKLIALYHVSGRMLAILLFSVAVVLLLGGKEILRLWTGDAALAERVAPIAAILTVGTAIHGTMYIPHAVQLAFGKTHIPLTINLALLVLMVPITIAFALVYGALGGAISWLLLHVLYVVLSVGLMDRFFGRGMGLRWLRREIGLPLAACAVAAGLGWLLLRSFAFTDYGHVAIAMLAAVATFLGVIGVSGDLKRELTIAVAKEIEP